MKIGIITYDYPHKKTQDLICRLKLLGYENIDLIVLPWVKKIPFYPIYKHRPDDAVDITTEQLCERFHLIYYRCAYDELDTYFSNILFEKHDKILIGGAGILPKELIKYNIINAHPGHLPDIRGLDALKWSILTGNPISVTTHFIGEKPDTGILIDRKFVPLCFTDTFDSVARRQYDLEIEMLADAITAIPDGEALEEKIESPVNKRMSHYDELRMIVRFNKLITGL
jgi:phosphoribosylglycinamide formyltransferase-1